MKSQGPATPVLVDSGEGQGIPSQVKGKLFYPVPHTYKMKTPLSGFWV